MNPCIARGALALAIVLGAGPTLAETEAGGGGFGLDLTVHGGLDKYDSVGLKSGLSSTDFNDSDRLRDWSQSYGLTAILRLGMLDVGALAEMGRPGKANSTAAVGGLVGLNFIIDRLQLDALGELGGHRYGDALHNTNVITDSNRSDWLMYVGLRPGVAVRLGDGGNVLLGLWGFARWDLTSKDVPVTFANGSGSGTYKLGGSQFGAALRLGFSL